MRNARRALPFLLAALAACSEASAPEEIALEFWTAVSQHRLDAAVLFSDARDAAELDEALAGFAPERSPAIGEARVQEDRARVEALFFVGQPPAQLGFDTHLVEADGAWRVELAATAEALSRARAAAPPMSAP